MINAFRKWIKNLNKREICLNDRRRYKKIIEKKLQDIVLKMQKILSDKQKEEFQKIVKVAGIQSENKISQVVQVRMSDALVAEKMVQNFSYSTFTKLHVEEMLHVGREELEDTEQFWKDWIALLKEKNGDTEARLLKEAILYCEGIDGLYKMAKENVSVHPSLYLAVLEQYDRGHLYDEIEKVGENALSNIDVNLTIRSEIALKTAFASSCLNHEEKMMQFCWESFVSNSTVRNYLRLFGSEKMAETYGMRGKEVLRNTRKGNAGFSYRNSELNQNIIGNYEYYQLVFYTGDFGTAKNISKNPDGSLGWSSSFIDYGIRLFLLYLYEHPFPSKAARSIASHIGFPDEKEKKNLLEFETEIQRECQEKVVSEFWNYFQRWKGFFPMGKIEREKYLTWAENIVYKRANAIVSGQHRSHYGEVAGFLAIVGEIKEDAGMQGAKRCIYEQYKKKFPRHSSFKREMKNYFNI